jgi:hypothetical protein
VFTPVTDNTGRFTLAGIAAGAYRLQVKNSHTLRNTVDVTLNGGANTVDLGTLREGDANNDNRVSLLDFSILAGTFQKCQGDPGYSDAADFNEDQCVTLLDFSLLASNFGQSGELALPPDTAGPSAGAVRLVIAPADTSVAVGQEFTLTVLAEAGDQRVSGAQVNLNFDPSLMRVVTLARGAALPAILLDQHSNAAGTIDYAAGTFANFPDGTFPIFGIRMVALSPTSGLGARVTFDLVAPRQSDVVFAGSSVRGDVAPGTIVIYPPVNRVFVPLALR